jgi:hypothetical protein
VIETREITLRKPAPANAEIEAAAMQEINRLMGEVSQLLQGVGWGAVREIYLHFPGISRDIEPVIMWREDR